MFTSVFFPSPIDKVLHQTTNQSKVKVSIASKQVPNVQGPDPENSQNEVPVEEEQKFQD
jgi:hypothetical protein